MTKNKQKLVTLVSALEEENIIDYLYTFVGLKVYGKAKLPENVTAELQQLHEAHAERCKQQEATPEEKEVMFYRAEIARAIYEIKSSAVLNYIYISVDKAHKEVRDGEAAHDNE